MKDDDNKIPMHYFNSKLFKKISPFSQGVASAPLLTQMRGPQLLQSCQWWWWCLWYVIGTGPDTDPRGVAANFAKSLWLPSMAAFLLYDCSRYSSGLLHEYFFWKADSYIMYKVWWEHDSDEHWSYLFLMVHSTFVVNVL